MAHAKQTRANLRIASPIATVSVRVSVSPTVDHTEAIYFHVNEICRLSDEYVTCPDGSCAGHPNRVAWHERQLNALGINKTSLFSFVNRAEVPQTND